MLRTPARGLVVEITDGTSESNSALPRNGVGSTTTWSRPTSTGSSRASHAELADHPVAAVGVTPGWLRSERMLENFGVTEDTWRDALPRVPASRSPSRPRTSHEESPRSPPTRARPGSPGGS